MTGVWVFVEQHDGKIANVSLEALGLARKLADGLSEKATAVVFGSGAAQLGSEAIQHGADNAIASDDATLKDFRADAYGSLLTKLAQERKPSVIIGGATVRGGDVLGITATDLEAGLITGLVDAELNGRTVVGTAPIYSGKLVAKVQVSDPGDAPQMLTIRSRAFPLPDADTSRSGDVETVGAAKAEADIPVKVTGFEETTGSVSLADAAIIVSGGRGVGGPDGYAPLKELTEVLGAALGASRAAVDAGWIPYEHQVGQTGKTVAPDLYIACGISGAVQHQAGMRTAKVIVAINKDADAPIWKLAHYGIVGDLFTVVPALTQAFKEKLGK
jgi:electron transfer flavoprotein alpha subunit